MMPKPHGGTVEQECGGKKQNTGCTPKKTKLLSHDFGGEQAESWGTKVTVDNKVDILDLEHSDVGSHEQQEST